MSVSSGRSSPIDRIQGVLRSMEEIRLQEVSSCEDRFRKYVHVVREQEHQLPDVSYQKKVTCCSVSKICSAISCCFQSSCCGRETNNFYISELSGNQIMLTPKRSSSLPSDEQNQLTNTSFFIDLYREHGDFLPFMISSAIAYLPTAELKEYWQSWDPESKELLDHKRAEDFRALLSQTHQVYDQVRMELMKKEMRERMTKLPPKEQVQRTLSHKQRPERVAQHFQPGEDAEEVMIAPAATRSKKYIVKEGIRYEFTQDQVIKDLLMITTCTPSQAQQAAADVEKFISDQTTTEEIWEVLLHVVYLHGLNITESYENMLNQHLGQILAQQRHKRVIDIPYDQFAQLIKTQQESRLASRHKSKKLTEKVAARKFETKQPQSFTITV